MTKPKEYRVNILMFGQATRVVRAKNEEEASRAVQKLLFEADQQTPRAKMLNAFAWDYPRMSIWSVDDCRAEKTDQSKQQEEALLTRAEAVDKLAGLNRGKA